MKPIDYLLCQMELEGIQRVSDGLITRSSPGVDDFPLVIIARTSDGESLIGFDATIPAAIRVKLPKDYSQNSGMETAINIFEESGFHVKASHFKTYVFPEGVESGNLEAVKCFTKDDPKIVDFGFHGLADKVFAIECDGMILSACVSSRQNSTAAEAWVFTHPDHRRKGLAQKVVAAWARSIKAESLIPFYSHNLENTDSAFLAKRLKLVGIFEETVIEKPS
jgi:hypothetical protein